jgi:hypothetical protein
MSQSGLGKKQNLLGEIHVFSSMQGEDFYKVDEATQTHLRQLRDILMTCALGSQKDEPIWAWENTKSSR